MSEVCIARCLFDISYFTWRTKCIISGIWCFSYTRKMLEEPQAHRLTLWSRELFRLNILLIIHMIVCHRLVIRSQRNFDLTRDDTSSMKFFCLLQLFVAITTGLADDFNKCFAGVLFEKVVPGTSVWLFELDNRRSETYIRARKLTFCSRR